MTNIELKMCQYLNPTPEYNKMVRHMTNAELDAYIEEHKLEKPRYSGCTRLTHKCHIVTKHMRGDK